MRLSIDRLAVDHRKLRAFDVCDEVTVRPTGNDGNLDVRLAERRQRLGQEQFTPGVGAVEDLDRSGTGRRRGGGIG